MEKIRFGVVGLGLWGETILDTLKGIREADIVAVASRSSERATEIAEKFGARRTYLESKELVEDPNVDAVVVATEEHRHVEPTVAALEAGKHVFLEKPIASTLEDVDQIIQTAKASDATIMVGHIFRFDGRHVHAKEMIEQGKIGKVASFFAKHNVVKKNYYLYRRVPLPMVSSVHEFDLARWYLDDEPEEVYCAQHSALGEEVADTYWITVKFRKGVVAAFQTVWLITEAAPVWLDINIEVMGTEGFIHLDSRNQGITIWSEEGTKKPMDGFFPVLRGVSYGALRNELEYFIHCLQDEKEPTVLSLEDAREALRIALLADESARTGKVIRA
jgi:UDP-N-acetylglucosamine 3-dehydrogenase